jgi:hypothetical protein
MGETTDCEAPDAFYRVVEGGETMSWRRNNQWRVEFFNASISKRREEEVAPVSEGERSRRAALGSRVEGWLEDAVSIDS